MYIVDLLEKQQQVQVIIFHQLLEHEFEQTVDELLTELQISRPTLLKEFMQLQQTIHRYHEQTSLQIENKERIFLILPINFPVQAFLYDEYYSQSINVQLIEYFYLQGEVSIPRLTMDFQLSEASLFRKLKHLNHLLSEFDLYYKNKQITGDSRTFQMFFFEFFTQIYATQRLDDLFQRHSFQNLVTILEKQLDLTLTSTKKRQLVIWLVIAEKRLENHDFLVNTQFSYLKTEPHDDYFKKVAQIFIRFSSRYAVQWPEELIYQFYQFLYASGILTISKNAEEETKGKAAFPTIIALSLAIEKELIEDPLSHSSYLFPNLVQLHCYILFFKRFLVKHRPIFPLLSDQNPTLMERCMGLVETASNHSLSTLEWRILDEQYGRMYTVIRKQRTQQKPIFYMMCISSDALFQQETQQFLAEYNREQTAYQIRLTKQPAKAIILLYDTCEVAPVADSLATHYRFCLADSQWTNYEKTRFHQFIQQEL